MSTHEARSTYKELDGEILPAYTGVNAPYYPRGEARDVMPPHDYEGSGPLDSSVDPVADRVSVSLKERDERLITVMNKWAEANKLEGHARGMHTPVHRARLGADDERAANSADKARRLRSEARDVFEQATGVKAMLGAGLAHELGDIDPDVLAISFFQDFKSRHLLDKTQLDKRRKLHRKNLTQREG